jgi:hypothetical protein
MNAAVWFGAALFFTLAIASFPFTSEMKEIFGPVYVGIIAQHSVERFFALQYWCGAVAILHQLAEWVYLGKRLQQLTCSVLLGVFAVGLLGGLWLQPKLNKLFQIKYGNQLYRREIYTPEQTARAARSFRVWHGVASVVNLLALGGLAFYTWRIVNPPGQGPRFFSPNKFRGTNP